MAELTAELELEISKFRKSIKVSVEVS